MVPYGYQCALRSVVMLTLCSRKLTGFGSQSDHPSAINRETSFYCHCVRTPLEENFVNLRSPCFTGLVPPIKGEKTAEDVHKEKKMCGRTEENRKEDTAL
jgi:hypothetical protein